MKKISIYFILIFFAVILQVSFVPVFFDLNWLPSIPLMLVLAWTLIDGFESFLGWAIFIGMIYDLATFSAVGSNVVIFSLLAYCVSFFSRRFSVGWKHTGIFIILFFVAASTMGSRLLISFYESGLDGAGMTFHPLWSTMKLFSLVTFYNIFIFLVLYFMIRKVEKYFHIRRPDNIVVRN